MWCVDRRLLAAVLVACWAGCAWSGETPGELIKRGDIAFNRGDLGDAIRLFRDAADQGYAPAQSRLAYVLDKAEENEEAVAWYRKAAEQGDATGQFGLGQMLSGGEGVDKDPVAGLAWVRRAADQGLLPAIIATARALEEGEPKTLRDPAAAVEYWRRAAAQGDHGALRRMVAIHRNGELGQAVNENEAKAWEAKLPPDPNAKRKRR